MNNFVKRIWFGALLRPQCWICAAVNHQVVGGAIAVLLFLLTGWFATAGFVALFVFLFMVHLIIFPEKTYTLQMEDKTLFIAIYASDFARRHRKDSKRKRFIIRTIACHADGFCETVWPDSEVFGYDDSLCRYGIFLAKPYPATWAVVCNGFEDGRFLGRKLCNYVFAERIAAGKNLLIFFHGTVMFPVETVTFSVDPDLSCKPGSVVFQEISPSGLPELSADKADKTSGRFLLCQNEAGSTLFKCCLAQIGMPAAYHVSAEDFCLNKH